MYDNNHMASFLPEATDPSTSTNRYLPSVRIIEAAKVEIKSKIEFWSDEKIKFFYSSSL